MRNRLITLQLIILAVGLLAGCAGSPTLGPLVPAPGSDAAATAAQPVITVESETPSPTVEPTVTPQPEAPTPTPTSALNAAALEDYLDDLSYWVGHWRSMRLTNTPIEDPVLIEVMALLVESADALNVSINTAALVDVQPYDESEALVQDMAQSLGEQYGPTVQATFEIRYATQVANLLLWFVNETMSVVEVQERAYLAGNYLSAAINSAQRAGLQGDLLGEGLQLSRSMSRGAEPLEASREVFMWRIRVLAWLGDQNQLAAAPAPDSAEPMRTPQELYISMGCIDCHYLQDPEDEVALNNLIAPSLEHLPELAAERVPGQDAVDYVYASIVDPRAHEVEGYQADLMPMGYADEMTDAEINAMVTWLLDPQRDE
ncbi:MAG: hypothetical protein R2873_34130 [Caldilineaceae bacterium]|nr:hypothetical protein [Caldilineaceae bacterium]